MVPEILMEFKSYSVDNFWRYPVGGLHIWKYWEITSCEKTKNASQRDWFQDESYLKILFWMGLICKVECHRHISTGRDCFWMPKSGLSELSTGHYFWTWPCETLIDPIRPAIADKKSQPTRAESPLLPFYDYMFHKFNVQVAFREQYTIVSSLPQLPEAFR